MERFWTGQKDSDRNILLSIDSDRDLLNSCLASKYATELCDDTFFYNRLLKKYGSTIPYKKEEISWKKYYLLVIYYIDKLKREFNFNFTSGNPRIYYDILKLGLNNIEDLVIENAARFGLNDLIEYYRDTDYQWRWSLWPALESGKKSTVELILKLASNEQERTNEFIANDPRLNLELKKLGVL